MIKVKILVNTIHKVVKFTNTIQNINADFNLISGKYMIDAKSIMGMMSLCTSMPLQLVIICEKWQNEEIMNAIKEYIVQ